MVIFNSYVNLPEGTIFSNQPIYERNISKNQRAPASASKSLSTVWPWRCEPQGSFLEASKESAVSSRKCEKDWKGWAN